MRSERLYLVDIVTAADEIAAFLHERSRDDFDRDSLLRSGILHQLMIIGEAAARLSSSFRQRHSDIEWPDVIAFRNRVVHAYFDIDWDIVWTTATEEVPELASQVKAILAQELPADTYREKRRNC